jgi:amino acid adenylation domain-containing protein
MTHIDEGVLRGDTPFVSPADSRALASATQHGMWVGEQLGAGPAYRMPLALWLDGDLDVTALRAACADVIARHPVLATTVAPSGGELRLAPAARPPVTITDASEPGAVDRLIRDETQAGFDLRTGPLARFTIAAVAPRRHLLLVVAHHLVFDGMSKDILVRGVARCYAARVTPSGGAPAEPEPPLSFPAAVAAERERAAAALPAAREFWTRRWSEPSPAVFPGPLRPAAPFGPGLGINAGIDPELGRDAAEVARAVGATTFEVLVAAAHALLFRYGAENVAVAIDVTTRQAANRDHIGPFVNELPVLSRPAPGLSFRDFTLAIRGQLRELYKFRDVPFTQAVAGAAGPQPSRAAPAAVSISYRKREAGPVFPGLGLSVDYMMLGGVRRPLHMHFVHGPDGLEMTLRFNPAAIDAGTAGRFADGLRAVARSAAADPGIRLADLDIMATAERKRMLADWNDTAVGYPGDATLPAMFAGQARATPDAVAVTSGGRSLSYARLDAAATRLARRLQEAGVRRGDLVAVHLRRSGALAACLLAVHRAGAAYLPLDPDHPAERLAMITADAAPRLLLTETASPASPQVPVLFVSEADVAGARGGDPGPDTQPLPPGSAPWEVPTREVPLPEVLPGEVAYVIYTSGSTGRPKGVEVEHRNLANLLLAMRDRLGARPDDTWLALTSPAFDIFALELYLPLIAGGRVVIAPHGAARRPQALAELAAREGVTHVQATPSVWRLLLPGGIAGVTALAGGEALPADLAGELRERCDRVFNVYGPTETTIWSTGAELAGPGEAVTIGRPLANTQVYLLDASMRPVPVGVAGELCIGGAGVARGYRAWPGRTAAQFVPDPFGPAGSRLYRTGDLARYRADGEIEFLGRRDGQVKLLGHRIELGEIETRLRAHAGLREAVVILDGAGAGDPRLVAYVVPVPGAAPRPAELTAHLAAILPAAMLPGAYVTLDALPLNPVGKLDRAALPQAPARDTGHLAATEPGTSPVPSLAAQVSRIWREVLDLDDSTGIGVADDLFDLGGHSLLITQITARVKERIGVDVSLDAVFDDPTIGGMVAEITRLQSASPEPDEAGGPDEHAVRPRPAGVRPPLSFAQERLWFLQRFDPDDASYNTYLVLRLRGRLEPGALTATLDALVARHESLRTSFPDVDGEPVTVIHPPAPCPVERIDLTGADDGQERARRLVADRVNAPFDLAAGPPLRFTLLRLGPGDHVLCLVLHHIICDGWSHGVLFDDLFASYQALAVGRDPDLPALPVQYGDIALWQRHQDLGQAAEESLVYWRGRLADPPRLELPVDKPRGQRPDGAFHRFQIPEEVITPLERLAQQHGASLFMVLLAAYQALLARHSGQDDILVGTPWAARDRVEFEPVIGYLTDTLVLRGDLSGDPSFADLLDATRRDVLDAHAHRIVPFERLIGELGLPRDVRRNPLLSAMVILHSQAADGTMPERVGDLGVELFDDGFRQVRLELTLEAWRAGQGMLAMFGYDATLFYPATVERLAERLGILLRAIADAPGTPVSRLPMLTAAELAAVEEASSGAPAGRRDPVPALFSRAVAAAPGATALTCGPGEVSYAELDARVSRVAVALQRRGVTPGDVVGVCLPRSVDAVAALLAVWRAGAAYLPLDPEYPDERLAFMITDARVRVVVTSPALAGRQPPGTGLVISGEPDGEPPADGEGRWPAAELSQPAYVIYTSGSTGRPKGVLVEHGALAARVNWMREAYGLGPADRVAQFASLSFDAHAEELWPALTAGASVLLLPDGAATLPDELRSRAGRQVTVLDLPTAYWHRLAEAPDEVTWPEPLRLVIIGGEQAHAAAVARWRATFGDRVRLVNTYGPTEAAIVATAAPLGAADAGHAPPIGRPVHETIARVLGPQGERVPPGVPGELYLGGAGLARGYLGRPALTAGRFVPDPYGPPGSRLYRTGDRVRLRADGNLEFLGRFDGQLKVRGFRVEPGEVTAALLAHPGVRQAAVTADGERLVAYVAGTAAPDELRGQLAATLPAYLVPSGWVSMDALPLTVTGKVDLAALPALAPAGAAPSRPPRTDAEILVAGVWAAVLGLDAGLVGAEDDFFALGGHSLLATRVAARLRNAVDVEVPIRTVFDQPTVAGLAVAVENLLIEQLSGLSDTDAAHLLEEGVFP